MNASQQFYDNLLLNTQETKRLLSLGRVKDACDFLDKQYKTKIFTVADVGRYCQEQWGGPKTQSIRNSIEILERYVKLRIAEHATSLSISQSSIVTGKSNLNLANPALAQQQYMLALAEIEQLRNEVARLKADVQRYMPLTTDRLLATARGDAVISKALEPSVALPQCALDAIRTLLDPEKLHQCEMVIDRHNYLIHEISGNELLNAKQVGSLLALID